VRNVNTITFKKSEIENLATFIAEIVRQGIVFVTIETTDTYEIEFTGGF